MRNLRIAYTLRIILIHIHNRFSSNDFVSPKTKQNAVLVKIQTRLKAGKLSNWVLL